MARDSWKRIRETIADRIARGDWAPGTRLPTEAELGRQFGAGRHSVRRALQALAQDGRLRIVQGSGSYVEPAPTAGDPAAPPVRLRCDLRDHRPTPAADLVEARTGPASAEIAAALGLAPGARVQLLVGRGRAGGLPVFVSRSWHPAALWPDLAAGGTAGGSAADLYRAAGLAAGLDRSLSLQVRRPRPDEARALSLPPDRPVVVVTVTDRAADGRVIGHGRTIWAAERVQFGLDGG